MFGDVVELWDARYGQMVMARDFMSFIERWTGEWDADRAILMKMRPRWINEVPNEDTPGGPISA